MIDQSLYKNITLNLFVDDSSILFNSVDYDTKLDSK
jgi:hypothetical protein